MYIFIDESNIHSIVGNSTFVLVYVEVDDYQKVNEKVLSVEKELLINRFHWSKATLEVKRRFLEEILTIDFKFKLAIIKNPINPLKEIERILPHMAIESNISKIIIDGGKPKRYERKIKKILRDNGLSLKKLKTANDLSESGLRIADAVAGLCRWYYDNKNHDLIEKYFKKLKNKLIITIE
jgi:hypothetical protein